MKSKFIFSTFVLFAITITANCQPNPSLDSLNRLLINAQIQNQLSQSEYYGIQSLSISSQWITVFGALGGSIVGLLGAFLIARINKRGEIEKFEKQLQEENIKNMKVAAAELMKKTAEAFHSLTWVLWIAKNTPSVCTAELFDVHDKKMNKIYSEIAGAQVVLSAYSKKIYEDTEPIVRHLYIIDDSVGRLAFGLKSSDTTSNAIISLGNMWQDVYYYSLGIPRLFANSLEIVLPQRV